MEKGNKKRIDNWYIFMCPKIRKFLQKKCLHTSVNNVVLFSVMETEPTSVNNVVLFQLWRHITQHFQLLYAVKPQSNKNVFPLQWTMCYLFSDMETNYSTPLITVCSETSTQNKSYHVSEQRGTFFSYGDRYHFSEKCGTFSVMETD